MSYQLYILSRAQKSLEKLPVGIYEQVRDEIRSLSIEPRPFGCKKLVGRDGWRIRIRKYRAVYSIDDEKQTLTVLDIDHRKDIYR